VNTYAKQKEEKKKYISINCIGQKISKLEKWA